MIGSRRFASFLLYCSDMAENPKASNEFIDLCTSMGLTLAVWQRLEDQHFLLFVKLLGAPKREICSVIYHGIPGFEGRRVMVDRVVSFSELTSEQKGEWKNIHSALASAAEDRNKIAHYSVEYDLVQKEMQADGSRPVELGSPHLRPSFHNVLKDRTAEKPGHKLTPAEMRGYVNAFNGLAGRLSALRKSISLPPPRQGLASGLLPFLDE
jgi:hypothetical protein